MRPAVAEFFSDESEHRRQIARLGNDLLRGRTNAKRDVTLTQNGTTTTIEWNGVTAESLVILVGLTANAGTALAGYWIQPTASQVVVNHAAVNAADLNCRAIALT